MLLRQLIVKLRHIQESHLNKSSGISLAGTSHAGHIIRPSKSPWENTSVPEGTSVTRISEVRQGINPSKFQENNTLVAGNSKVMQGKTKGKYTPVAEDSVIRQG